MKPALVFFFIITTNLAAMSQKIQQYSPADVVRQFLLDVRSGKNPDNANLYMADTVIAHQVVSEEALTVYRTPAEYAEHVRETLRSFGNYSIDIQEIINENNKVYARWKLTGKHFGEIDG